jgi:aspartyl-tRNA synthetase
LIRRRTDYCGDLREEDAGRTVTVAGWVHRRRDHGGLVFLDVRDRSGIVQVVAEPDHAEAFQAAERVRGEYVVAVTGVVRRRPAGMDNPELATGRVEIAPDAIEILAASETPPFSPADAELPDELLRLQYRYIDLRRPTLQQNLILRDRVTFAVREYFHRHGFLEIETPQLARSTPEGARDFLVPSRTHPGRFYALPQSPQIFKQLLMVAGLDRYYQIVRVFRDEDLRADRQPEFTQIDVETSFLDQEQILELMEGMVHHVFQASLGVPLQTFPRLTHAEAFRLYGSDKPDLRAGPPLRDFGALLPFLPEDSPLRQAEALLGVVVEGAAPSRRQLDDLVEWARQQGFPGLVWAELRLDTVRSNAGRVLGPKAREALQASGVTPGQWVFLVAGGGVDAPRHAGQLRIRLAQMFGRMQGGFHFLWVTEFPLFEWSEEEQRLKSAHHPFTMPMQEDWDLLETDPLRVRSQAYDVVLNGVELASGSVRIHDAALQARIFRLLGLTPEQIEHQFGFLVNAFRYGPPPHGGIAFGLDRLVMMMAGADSLREVIAFPKTSSGTDAMMAAPSVVEPEQLRELRLRIVD